MKYHLTKQRVRSHKGDNKHRSLYQIQAFVEKNDTKISKKFIGKYLNI